MHWGTFLHFTSQRVLKYTFIVEGVELTSDFFRSFRCRWTAAGLHFPNQLFCFLVQERSSFPRTPCSSVSFQHLETWFPFLNHNVHLLQTHIQTLLPAVVSCKVYLVFMRLEEKRSSKTLWRCCAKKRIQGCFDYIRFFIVLYQTFTVLFDHL